MDDINRESHLQSKKRRGVFIAFKAFVIFWTCDSLLFEANQWIVYFQYLFYHFLYIIRFCANSTQTTDLLFFENDIQP